MQGENVHDYCGDGKPHTRIVVKRLGPYSSDPMRARAIAQWSQRDLLVIAVDGHYPCMHLNRECPAVGAVS